MFGKRKGRLRFRPLFIAWHGAGTFRAEDNAGNFIAQKIRNELLKPAVSVKVDLVVQTWIIVQDFRHHLGFCPAAHDDFVSPHKTFIINRCGDYV